MYEYILQKIKTMTLINGKTYKFKYIEDIYTKTETRLFKLHLADENDNSEYLVRPLTSQETTPNYELYCKVINIEDNGYVKLVQDEMAFYSEVYKSNQIYTFTIKEELTPTENGVRKVILENKENNLTHVFTCFDGMDSNVGEYVEYGVRLIDRDGRVAINFLQKEEDLDIFRPENVFKAIHREEWKEHFFDNLEEWAVVNKEIQSKIFEMKGKLFMNNRLWLFDYIRCLLLTTILSDVSSLNDIEKSCILIKDIELWILEDSGLLSKFNPQKREDTRKKSEQLIDRVEYTLEAISIIKANQQVEFVQDMVSKLQKSLYIRNKDKSFRILFRIIGIDKEIIKNNIKIFSELVEYCSEEIGDYDIAERIIYMLSSYIYKQRKLLNKELHYKRNKDIDKSLLANIIIGIGTLLNFSSSKELDKNNDFSIDANQLFTALCKYLSYMCGKERSLELINKSLLAVLGKNVKTIINGGILRNVEENPDALIDQILQIDTEKDTVFCGRYANNIHLNVIDGNFTIHRGNHLQGIDNLEKNTCVYTITGAPIQLHDLSAIMKWENSDSLLYYRDKWRELLESEIFTMEVEYPDYVYVRVKPITDRFNNLIFVSVQIPFQS